MNSIVISGFFIGLIASFHCIGMCGPFALIVPVKRNSIGSLIFGSLQYNGGRILSYAFLGLISGILGVSLQLIFTFQIISILSGIFMFLIALSQLFQPVLLFKKLNSILFSHVSFLFGKIKKLDTKLKPLLFGFINGFLPCGMVYLAMINAIPSSNLLNGILAMIAFGFGTFLTMFFVPILVNINHFKNRFRKLAPFILGIVGLSLILRGMNLGIPYLSPEIKIEKNCNHSKPKLSCCKSK
jgi:sulfite exporter TauE/SafE